MTQPVIDEIVRRIVEAFRPQRIIMFGSRARGDARPDADLDLMVEMETSDPPAQRVRVIDALFGLHRWAMDLVVYTPQEVREQRQYRNSLIRVSESKNSAHVGATPGEPFRFIEPVEMDHDPAHIRQKPEPFDGIALWKASCHAPEKLGGRGSIRGETVENWTPVQCAGQHVLGIDGVVAQGIERPRNLDRGSVGKRS